jgi:hypothetical protein
VKKIYIDQSRQELPRKLVKKTVNKKPYPYSVNGLIFSSDQDMNQNLETHISISDGQNS